MEAVVLGDFGEADVLHVAAVREPECRPHDLLVKVHAAGVNRADIIQRQGTYGYANFGDSTLLGLEIAGEVVAMGSKAKEFNVGDRVMGIVGGGGYAEIARIDYRMAIPIPENLDYVQAAAIPEAFVTAHEALVHLGRTRKGEQVLVHAAASGVGLACVQLAKALGARVIATTSGAKLERVRAIGADIAIDYKKEDWFKQVLADGGVDVVIDFIGKSYLERNIKSLSNGGRLVHVGLLGGDAEVNFPLDVVLYRYLRIVGTVMKSRPPEVKRVMVHRFVLRWLDYFKEGKLMPIVDQTFPLTHAADAHRRMEANLNFGKIILVIGH